MKQEEIEIIRACQAGDLAQFSKLYDTYARKIYDFVYYRVQHRPTAEDLTSQTFFKVLESIAKYQDNSGNFSAWLYKIARNLVIDYYRTRKNEDDIADYFGLNDGSDLERDLDTREKLKNVEKYLHSLKPELREIIIMRVWQELSYQEIAAILNKSEASCKMQFSRAIAKLRQELPLAILILLLTKL